MIFEGGVLRERPPDALLGPRLLVRRRAARSAAVLAEARVENRPPPVLVEKLGAEGPVDRRLEHDDVLVHVLPDHLVVAQALVEHHAHAPDRVPPALDHLVRRQRRRDT